MNILAELAEKTLMGGRETTVPINGKGQINAVICGMIELDRETSRRLQQRPRRRQLDLSSLQKPRRQESLLSRQLSSLNFLPEDVRAFRDKEIWRDQFGSLAQGQRLRRPILLDQPLTAMLASMTSASSLISTFAQQDL